MKTYIGTKIITAEPMTRADYNTYRNWTLPENEDGTDEGYLVEYTDGGKPNDSRHAGYISWSPKAQFEGAYRETSGLTFGLTFGLALEMLKKGAKVARAGWGDKSMSIFLAPDGVLIRTTSKTLWAKWDFRFDKKENRAGWHGTPTDMLAEDWLVVV